MGNKWVEIKKIKLKKKAKKNKQINQKKSRREQFRYYQMQVRIMIKVSGTRIYMSYSLMTPGGPSAKV